MKKLFSVLLVLSMLFSLVSCSKADGESDSLSSSSMQSSVASTEPIIEELPTIEECKAKLLEFFPNGTITNISTDSTNKNGERIYSFYLIQGFNIQLILTDDNRVRQIGNNLVTQKSTTDEGLLECMSVSMYAAYALMALHESNTYSYDDVVRIISDRMTAEDGRMTFEDTYIGDFLVTGFVSIILNSQTIFFSCRRMTLPPKSSESPSSQAGGASSESASAEGSQAADPCANGHSYSEATCAAPATCKNCGKTTGGKLAHDLYITKCRNCDYTDFSKIAKTYTDVSAYDSLTGADYSVSNVKLSSSGVFSFSFKGKSYSLTLKQTERTGGNADLVVFDCYNGGSKLTNAYVEYHEQLNNPRLTWENLDGCNLYIYAE